MAQLSTLGHMTTIMKKLALLFVCCFCFSLATIAADVPPKSDLTVKSFSFIGSDTTLKQAFDKIGSSGALVQSLQHSWYCYRLSDGTDVQIIVSNSDPSSSIQVVIHQDATGHLIETLYSKKEK